MEWRARVYELTARRAKHYPELTPMSVQTDGLDAREAALCRALDQEIVRRWLTLKAIAASRLSRPWEQLQPQLQAAVLVGAAELLLMERKADHAAINEAVQWVKSAVRPKAGGLVNAVLRGVARLRGEYVSAPATVPGDAEEARGWIPLSDGGAWQLTEAVLAEEPTMRLAQQTSHSPALIERWRQQHGLAKAAELAWHSLVHPPLIVTGADDDAMASVVSLEVCQRHDEPGFWTVTGGRAALDELFERMPTVRVQDPTAARAATLSHDRSPTVIADVCAGRGTKTGQLATMHPQATVLATDVDDDRRSVLRRTFAQHDRVRVIEPRELDEHRRTVELLVFDMPCSNTGVLARRLEARHRFTNRHLADLVQMQRQIIADYLSLLTENGAVLYTTCSLEEDENADQIAWIQQWHEMDLVREMSRMPAGRPGDPPQQYRDGGYAALLARA